MILNYVLSKTTCSRVRVQQDYGKGYARLTCPPDLDTYVLISAVLPSSADEASGQRHWNDVQVVLAAGPRYWLQWRA